ncbi:MULTISPECIES: hypothetical protein [Streptomyces]|uniref:DUF732 domain-containing protein n=1 Tax=Streptomyces glycanivorans TaxID=3033808 RepID=A0ABY9J6W4_9ACTN|nr:MULTISPECIES: hypothetical protein [unclassified Streptomyces]WSQ76897.1 hypothetical protein OG725_07255 [Streptomyces sp. NBC_01213]TXS19912.1 hypothetical protein EAO68_01005 [Streptomyces sp. wa22]WLQ63516.1 hypothetical protein P8A20_07920 [Streptomyces sp. Alt3]WSQ84225.1 hypothetical protein OG722_07685 [Streptomyces sp. NBC_01212]WSR09718.1 hypothetical protein OG265_28480 [Streptomyces sp. NBC_01208]
MRYPFLAGAAVALATAVLAACGSSGGSGDGGTEAAAGSKPSAAASATPSVAGPAAGTTAPKPQRSSDVPKVPAGEITPATGSFTEKQKEYLTDRVPEGMDPAAVLQTGQETCDRLRYLVKADRDIAVGAIVSGEVADAKPAVAHLCPRHQDLVDEAALGYADGTYEGSKVRPGRYRAASPTTACSWQLTGAGGKELDSGSSATGKQVEITVPGSARTFTSTGCYAWLPRGENG